MNPNTYKLVTLCGHLIPHLLAFLQVKHLEQAQLAEQDPQKDHQVHKCA